MQEKNKNGYSIRGNTIYVQGSIDNEFKRYSTGKKATKINIAWAKRNARDVLLQLHNIKINKQSITTNDFIKFAYLSFDLNSSNRKESTTSEYIRIFKKYIEKEFTTIEIQNIKKADCLKWQNKMLKTKNDRTNELLTVKSIKFIRAIFSGILSDAVDNDLISINPFSKVKMPIRKEAFSIIEKDDEEIYPFTFEEAFKIIDLLEGQIKHFITMQFFSGMRAGEGIGLLWSDIDFEKNQISINRAIRHGVVSSTKTDGSKRKITMLPEVKKALKEQYKLTANKNNYVFLTKFEQHYNSAQSINRNSWKNILKKLSIKYRPIKQTRHTFASQMISNGEDVLWVSRMLGHSNANITLKVYAMYIPNNDEKRASFLNKIKEKNCTKTAQIKFKLLKSS